MARIVGNARREEVQRFLKGLSFLDAGKTLTKASTKLFWELNNQELRCAHDVTDIVDRIVQIYEEPRSQGVVWITGAKDRQGRHVAKSIMQGAFHSLERLEENARRGALASSSSERPEHQVEDSESSSSTESEVEGDD